LKLFNCVHLLSASVGHGKNNNNNHDNIYSGSGTLGTLLLKLGWDERDTNRVGCGRQDTPVVCQQAAWHVLITIVKAYIRKRHVYMYVGYKLL